MDNFYEDPSTGFIYDLGNSNSSSGSSGNGSSPGLLDYLKRKNLDRYRTLIAGLGIRK